MGELEAQVLNVLWDHGGWMTPGEVNAALGTKPPLAYTTVMTILVRLHTKGILERETRGRAWSYHPLETREEAVATRMHDVLDGSGERTLALARFVDGINAEERKALRQALEQRRR